MRNLVSEYVSQFRQDRQKQLKLAAVLAALAVLVAGFVFWQLHSTGLAMSNEVFCGQEEHTHSEDCYETVLVCGLEETGGHTHTDACYEKVPVCGIPEHTHTVDCLIDETADLETDADWEATLPGLTGDRAADVAAVAESQVGYTESQSNFRLADDGETRQGYTRYGAWYGNEYGDWDAMFAAFCLYYAGADREIMPAYSGAYAWVTALAEEGLFEDDADFTPQPGDLAFLDEDGDGLADTVAVVDLVDGGDVTVIQGDKDDAVAVYTLSAGQAAGYGVLPDPDTASGGVTPLAEGAVTIGSVTAGDVMYVTVTAVDENEAENDVLSTGESVRADITAGVTGGADPGDSYIRVYFVTDENVGLPDLFQDGVTTTFGESGASVSVTPHLLSDGTWCLDIDASGLEDSGGAADFNITFGYAKGLAPGSMEIFAEVIPKSGNGDLADDYEPVTEDEDEKLDVEWTTDAAAFGTEKAAAGSAAFAEGPDDAGIYYVTGLTYTISSGLTQPNDYNDEGYGLDYVGSVTYTDTLTLPEGLEWAVSLDDPAWTGGTVTCGGVTVCTVSGAQITGAALTGDGLAIGWTAVNTTGAADGSLAPADFTITYGDSVIRTAETPEAGEDFSLVNSVSATAEFRDSGKQTAEAEAAAPLAADAQDGVPVMQKELEDYYGVSSEAGSDLDFTYLVYEGDSVALTGWTTEDELIRQLEAAGITSYGTFTVTVPAGESSAARAMDDIDVLAPAGTADWTWTEDEDYTVIELPGGSDYSFYSLDSAQNNSLTFRYSSVGETRITNVNRTAMSPWSLTIVKTDATGNPIDGAVFTLSQTTAGESGEPVVRYYDGESGQWVEAAEGTGIPTVTLGILPLEDLADGDYELTEIRPPDGYSLPGGNNAEIKFTVGYGQVELTAENPYAELSQSGDDYTLTMLNAGGMKLPSSGGPGAWLFYAAGAVIIAGAAGLLVYRKRRAV